MRAKMYRLLSICGGIDYVQVQASHLTIHFYIKMQRPILVPNLIIAVRQFGGYK
jgi:hypothetical protein